MTEVAFHFNAEDRLAYTCRLLRKAVAKGARLMVLAREGESRALSQALWTVSAGDFVPHGHEFDAPEVQRRSPVLIVESELPLSFRAEALVNLTQQVPPGFERFARVIEVVSRLKEDREQARYRWRQYQAAGLVPEHHDLSPSVA